MARGREVGSRFELFPLWEVTVEVDNTFDAANREALATAEQRLSEVPGVRRVLGPGHLLEVTVDAGGKAVARQVLARGASESEGEEARQRVVRRADALGWFVSANGRQVRFLIDTADFERARPQLEAALARSGLELVRPPGDGGMGARPLWPDPRGRGARWLPAALAAAWMLFVVISGVDVRSLMGRFSRVRTVCVVLAAAAAAAALFLPVPVGGVRAAGGRAAAAAAGMVMLALLFRRRQALRPARPERPPRRGRPPGTVLLLALGTVAAAVAVAPRLRVGTHQWDEAPLLYVSVRGDLDEPVVLRELRRLTDFVRAQPGVANAWSIADLFMGVAAQGEEASRIPDDADQVRRVLVQARNDPAVRLELSADHREGLVGIRFDDESPADRLELTERLAAYISTELRTSLLHIDLRAAGLPPSTRALGKGLLASDTQERVRRICARSGRTLSGAEAQAVERAARQAAIVPTADPGRLKAELGEDAREFVARYPFPLRGAEQQRLVDELATLPDEATVADVRAPVVAAYGGRLSDTVLQNTAEILQRRIATVRRRHTARINFKEMLYGADLPTEGVLADEVRSATLEGMGPTVGIPVARDLPAAFKIDAAAVGGAVNDRALSDAWGASWRAGVVGALALLTVLLLIVGGVRGVTWLPVALAPVAAAVLGPALAREPVGLWSLSFFAGALAAGAVIATSLAARRRA